MTPEQLVRCMAVSGAERGCLVPGEAEARGGTTLRLIRRARGRCYRTYYLGDNVPSQFTHPPKCSCGVEGLHGSSGLVCVLGGPGLHLEKRLMKQGTFKHAQVQAVSLIVGQEPWLTAGHDETSLVEKLGPEPRNDLQPLVHRAVRCADADRAYAVEVDETGYPDIVAGFDSDRADPGVRPENEANRMLNLPLIRRVLSERRLEAGTNDEGVCAGGREWLTVTSVWCAPLREPGVVLYVDKRRNVERGEFTPEQTKRLAGLLTAY